MPGYKRRKNNKRSDPCRSIIRQTFILFAAAALLIKSGKADELERAVTYAGTCFEYMLSQNDDKPESETPVINEQTADVPQSIIESSTPVLSAPTPVEEQNISPLTIEGDPENYDGSGTVYVKNQTDYEIDVPALLSASDPVRLSGDAVQVLVMHTHGTEAYSPTTENNYTPSDTDRTTDISYNVVRVGREIAEVLNSRGIKTIHSTTLNDSPAYSGSYNRALDDISAQIKDNPSIKMVIDVHRDAMVTASGLKYKTIAEIEGQQAAQLMLVCGTDGGGLTHDNWRQNLSFQLKLQDRLNTAYPGIMRPLDLRAARFNQHVTCGSMLVEVGTSGNTLEEALFSARLFAESLADMLLER
ncbi:MAG: stage II sporulation protein P [Clostridia bacterium]|nr:stage II sporulation protein P [Clostridia bacterium]